MKNPKALFQLSMIAVLITLGYAAVAAAGEPATVTVRVTSANGDVTDLEVHTEKTNRGNTLKTDKVTYVSNGGNDDGGESNNENNQKMVEDALISTFDLTRSEDLKTLLGVHYK